MPAKLGAKELCGAALFDKFRAVSTSSRLGRPQNQKEKNVLDGSRKNMDARGRTRHPTLNK